MKNKKSFLYAVITAGILLLTACDPNIDLYEKMDEARPPYSESIEYTLENADYNRFEGFIADNHAFNDSLPAMNYVPEILASRFVTLKQGSSVMVTFNHFLLHPDWWDAGFGYVLTEENYSFMGVGNTFTPNNPASENIPDWLDRAYAEIFGEAEDGDMVNIIYNFTDAGETQHNEDTYQLDGEVWLHIETRENIPYIGYELVSEDYEKFGGSIAQFQNFSENNPPENYLPAFLKDTFSFAPINAEQVLKYRYHDGSTTRNRIDKYVFDGARWHHIPYFEERSEQYIYGEEGWAFDPTVIFEMGRDDFTYLVEIDPVGQQEFAHPDFGYYYGASVFYNNFDIRIIGRRLDKLESGEYSDAALGEIFEQYESEAEGAEAVMEEMIRRIIEEGLIYLLQHKFPDAQPQLGGIDVHFFVGFETFADNWVRRFPQAEYICTAPGNPPQFELVNFIENREE